jgi:hypothetical protein
MVIKRSFAPIIASCDVFIDVFRGFSSHQQLKMCSTLLAEDLGFASLYWLITNWGQTPINSKVNIFLVFYKNYVQFS